MTGEQPRGGAPTEDVRRALGDLMRLVNAIVADNRLSTPEIRFLGQWLDASKSIADIFPADRIYRRIREVMSDGIITREEQEQLLAELKVHSASAPSAPEE